MQQITIRLPEGTIDALEQEAEEAGVSRSEHVRDVIESRAEADRLRAELAELDDRLEAREERIDQLEEQLAKRSQVEEKVDVLATRVEDQEQAIAAPFFVRWARWWRSRGNGAEA